MSEISDQEIREKWREICLRDRTKNCVIDSGAFAIELARWLEQETNRWVPCELIEPHEYGDALEFKDKNGSIYTGYWNCGFISCDEAGRANKQIIDVVGWRILASTKDGEG